MNIVTRRAIAAVMGIGIALGMGTVQAPSVRAMGQGLQTTSYALPQGTIKILLPDDLAAGEKFTGTVVAVPNGKTEAERVKNDGILQGYVVATGESTAKPGQALKFATPAAGVAVVFKLLNAQGGSAGTSSVPMLPNAPPAAPNFNLPEIVQPGKPFTIPGPFDGDLSNVSVKIGGQAATPVAESPRQTIGICQPNLGTGPTSIEITEGTATTKGETHVASISLRAQRTLNLGQTTPVDITIRGMQGFDKPSSLVITNHTPSIVRLNNRESELAGNLTQLELSPFGAGETVRTIESFTLHALTPGAFEVECILLSGKCGATTHELDIVGPSKTGNARNGYNVEWKEVCMLGTCYLKAGHAGDHEYSWQRCKVHADIPHKETFKTQDERDAKYREVEKDAKERKAKHSF